CAPGRPSEHNVALEPDPDLVGRTAPRVRLEACCRRCGERFPHEVAAIRTVERGEHWAGNGRPTPRAPGEARLRTHTRSDCSLGRSDGDADEAARLRRAVTRGDREAPRTAGGDGVLASWPCEEALATGDGSYACPEKRPCGRFSGCDGRVHRSYCHVQRPLTRYAGAAADTGPA